MHDPLTVAFRIVAPWHRRWPSGRKYRPELACVWHREPGGHDGGTICRTYDLATGRALHAWRWHVWHWRLQFPPLQELRRRLLTRCQVCGGRHDPRGRRPVNVALSWEGPRGRFWQGEPGLVHAECYARVRG